MRQRLDQAKLLDFIAAPVPEPERLQTRVEGLCRLLALAALPAPDRGRANQGG